MRKLILFLISVILLGRCESSGSGVPVDIPNVDVDCQNAKCASATAGYHEVVVTFTGSGCPYDQIEVALKATGTANILCNGSSRCVGTVTSWRNINSQAITQIESSTYSVCGWLDNDGLAGSTAGDAFAEENLLVSGASISLTDWDAQNERSGRRVQIR